MMNAEDENKPRDKNELTEGIVFEKGKIKNR